MASKIKDGGPEFPRIYERAKQRRPGVMRLRDYIAVHALDIAEREGGAQTAADAEKEMSLKPGTYCYKKHWPLLCARRAYAYADAMLIAREEIP